jgi:hypothetical protein
MGECNTTIKGSEAERLPSRQPAREACVTSECLTTSKRLNMVLRRPKSIG